MSLYSERLTKRIRSSGDVLVEAGSDISFTDSSGSTTLSSLMTPVGGSLLVEQMGSSQTDIAVTNNGAIIPDTQFDFVHPGAQYGNVIVEFHGVFNVEDTESGASTNSWIELRRIAGAVILSKSHFTHSNTLSNKYRSVGLYWVKEYAAGTTDSFHLYADGANGSDLVITAKDWGYKYIVRTPAALSSSISGFSS